MGDDLHRTHALMAVQVIGDLLQTVLARLQLHHLGTGRHTFKQARGILDPGIDEQHALARHRRLGRIDLALGRACVCRLVGGGGLGRLDRGMGIRLRGIGHGGRDRAVEQHSRLQAHDHWRCQGVRALGYPRFAFAPPHDDHPDSNDLNTQKRKSRNQLIAASVFIRMTLAALADPSRQNDNAAYFSNKSGGNSVRRACGATLGLTLCRPASPRAWSKSGAS